ncbi:MAG TPA: 2-oxoacid:acceptor oxidoreductase subunit alpha [Desulfosalsimonadaceae bacterium]|nr:2-oxoacid:acceptor oxidoreductase subunit alpha [Desulfosalsimonadaceae bacterium]
MSIDITVTIGGSAGQGIQTVGDLLAGACHRSGLYLMAVNDFESRIRGGHSFMQIRISDQPVAAPYHQIHLLVCLNQESYDRHRETVAESGRILVDQSEATDEPNVLAVPFTQMAEDAGGKIMTNAVAAGACLALMGAPESILEAVLKERFGQKASVLENNINAARKGYDAVREEAVDWRIEWPDQAPKGQLLSGARALALGALAADCRLAAFYPMSPATGIMVNLAEFTDQLPLVLEQAEGEIAAMNMVIGGAFAGVRSMTATSGGGFSLMTEGLGLAAITETPMVVINAQRPGPATGLPTRTGQGDLQFVIHASQDEFPRFVLAPASINHAFDTVVRGFHLAEKYQVPVIILVDQYFNDSLFIATDSLTAPEQVERFLVSDADMAEPAAYKRFALTETGISPRALPCRGKARVTVTANEHSEDGHISETISDRNNMVNKRNGKFAAMLDEMTPPAEYFGDSKTLLVGWGSTDATIREAVDMLRKEDYDVGALIFSDLWPFPAAAVQKVISKADRFFTVELNASSQLGRLIREQTGLSFERAIVKYDGRPFMPNDIAAELINVMGELE